MLQDGGSNQPNSSMVIVAAWLKDNVGPSCLQRHFLQISMETMHPPDLSSSVTMRFTFVVLGEISLKLLDCLKSLQTFMSRNNFGDGN